MIRNCIDTRSSPRVDPRTDASGRRPSLAKLLNQIALCRERAHSRRLLLQFDDRMLRDIGLSRSDVERECAKFFWQI